MRSQSRLAVLMICLEYLHRHPKELDLNVQDIAEIMAYDRWKQDEWKRKR